MAPANRGSKRHNSGGGQRRGGDSSAGHTERGSGLGGRGGRGGRGRNDGKGPRRDFRDGNGGERFGGDRFGGDRFGGGGFEDGAGANKFGKFGGQRDAGKKPNRAAIRGSKAVPKSKKKNQAKIKARIAGPEFDSDDEEEPKKVEDLIMEQIELEPELMDEDEEPIVRKEIFSKKRKQPLEEENIKENEEEDDDGEKGDNEGSEQEEEEVNGTGFANAMAQILSKPVAKKAPILAQDKTKEKELSKQSQERKKQKEKLAEKLKRLDKERASVTDTNLNYEKQLRKLATRGVIRLFNAISKQQKDIEKKTESAPAYQKDRVLEVSKDNFLQLLKSGTKQEKIETKKTVSQPQKPAAAENTQDASWNVFKDDYLMGPASLKGWEHVEPTSENQNQD